MTTTSNVNNTFSSAQTTLDSFVKSVFDAYNYASIYWEAPFITSGLLFNLTTLIVFGLSTLGTAPTTRFYYILIACCEVSTLIVKHLALFMLSNGIFIVGAPPIWRVQGDLFVCRMAYATWLFVEELDGCALVALGVERAIVVYWPFSARKLTRRRSMIGMGCLAAFGLTISSVACQNSSVQTNVYVALNAGCYAGGNGVSLAVAVLAPTALICDYLIPTVLSVSLSVLIVLRLQAVKVQTAALTDAKRPQGLSAREIESSITLILMSTMHVLFLVPLTIFRTMAILLPYFVTLSPQTRLFLTAMGLFFFVAVVPMYSANFIIYCRRVKGFAQNVKRLWLCQSLLK